MVLELQDEDIKWILERRIKHDQFIAVFARPEENFGKKGPDFLSSCNPFPSWPSVVKGTCLQFQYSSRAALNKTGPSVQTCFLTSQINITNWWHSPLKCIWAIINVAVVCTSFKRGLESREGGGCIAVSFKMHPNHVSSTLYCTRIGAATIGGISEDWSRSPFKVLRIVRFLKVGLSDFQVVVFAVVTLFQFEVVKAYFDLATFRDN